MRKCRTCYPMVHPDSIISLNIPYVRTGNK